MSNCYFAFINKSDVPSRSKLQKALLKHDFALELDAEFTPFTDEGFSPCVLDEGASTGFEIFYEPAAEVIEDDEELLNIADGKDFCISLQWGGEFEAAISVMMVAAALRQEFGAIISYAGDEPETLETLLEGIDECRAVIADESDKAHNLEQSKNDLASAGSTEEFVKSTITSNYWL